jgi:hypothetical protein
MIRNSSYIINNNIFDLIIDRDSYKNIINKHTVDMLNYY